MSKVSKIIVYSLIIIITIAIIIVSIATLYPLLHINSFNKNNSDYKSRIDEILSDDIEIERKWLVRREDIPFDLTGKEVHVYDIKQTYLCFDPEMRVREYNGGLSYEFTIKTNMTKDGMIRDEVNYDINKEQYDNLIKKQEGTAIHKTRYQLYDDGQLYAFDIFHDDLDGLVYMEIEFPNKEESVNFKEPDWVIKDVTSDIRYKNGHLARYGIPEEK